MPVYAATLGFTSTATVIDAALAAAGAGVDAVQIHPPRPGPSAIVPRPAELSGTTATSSAGWTSPVHVTNQVVMVGYRLPIELVVELVATYPQVCAVNTSDPDLPAVGRLIRAAGSEVEVYVGIIAQLVTALSLGGAGALSSRPTSPRRSVVRSSTPSGPVIPTSSRRPSAASSCSTMCFLGTRTPGRSRLR